MFKNKTYDKVFTFQNLFTSYLKARKCKRHKREVIEFEMNLYNNLWNLKHRLDNRTYTITSYNHFVIYEPKKRDVDAIPFVDRLVQRCLVDNYLMPILERKLIYDNGACRKGKGTDFSRDRLKGFMVDYYHKHKTNKGYFLKMDLHHYFECIDHDILKEKLKSFVMDKDIYDLCSRIIDSFHPNEGKGLPLGNQTSQCFALIYLDRIDRLIKERYSIKYYTRYMDDLVVIDNSKEKLLSLLSEIKEKIEEDCLSLNEKKSFISPLDKTAISWLGFNYRINENGKMSIRVINAKRRSFLKHLKIHDEPIMKSIEQQYQKYLLIRQR